MSRTPVPDREDPVRDSFAGIESRRDPRSEEQDLPARVWREIGPGVRGGMLASCAGGALSALLYGLQFGDTVHLVLPMLRQFITVVVLSGLCVGVLLGVGARRVARGRRVFNPAIAGVLAGVVPGMYGVETLARHPVPFMGTLNLVLSPLVGALMLQTVVVRDALAQRGIVTTRLRVAAYSFAMLVLVAALCGAVFAFGPPLFETLKGIYFNVGSLASGAVCGGLFGGIVGAHTWLTLAAVSRGSRPARPGR